MEYHEEIRKPFLHEMISEYYDVRFFRFEGRASYESNRILIQPLYNFNDRLKTFIVQYSESILNLDINK